MRVLRVVGDRTHAVRRLSVVCTSGQMSASVWDDTHGSPHSVIPSVGFASRFARGCSGRLPRGMARPREKGKSLTTDQTLRCRDCGQEFVFTVGEQEFYASRGLTHAPARCPECRTARKASAGGGYGDRGPRQMYTATCSNCGGEARVPFQPRGDKPVYCSDCFQQMGGGARGGAGSSGSYGRSF